MLRSDLCVVGGGPAGACYATLARRAGRSVVLIDGIRGAKPAVETISAEAVRLLREAGLGWCLEASGGVRSSGTIDAWRSRTSPVSRSSIMSPWGSAWHVDRARFDTALRRGAADAGVAILEDSIERAASTRGCFRLTGRRVSIISREVVDASGASARVARLLGVRRTVIDRQLVVFSRLLRGLTEPALVVSSFAHGWLYLTAASAATTQAAVVTDRDVLRTHGTRAVVDAALDSIGLPAATGSTRTLGIAGAPTQFVHGHRPDGFSSIGDAEWTPDPLSGHGVARALHAAVHLAGGARRTPAYTAPPILEHLRERARLHASTPWADEPYYRNRARAYGRAKEALHGDSLDVD